MNKMTRLEAIEKTLTMWRRMVETGISKGDYLAEVHEFPYSDCFLCEFAKIDFLQIGRLLYGVVRATTLKNCSNCPYYQAFGGCFERGRTLYERWLYAGSLDKKRYYAGRLVKQLEQLERMERKGN